ncbi:hypothetical protein ACQFYA_21135 [Promicromonospora sp. Marseille-Q5078]
MSTIVRAWCDCGWHGEYRSTAVADFAGRQHSCDRWRAKREAARRRAERERVVDRTPKPCLHKVAHHEHGSHACYVLDRCRCRPCADANSVYESDRARRLAYGRTDLVDAEPVREHVRRLAAAGIGLKTLAQRSGVARGSLWKLMYGVTRPDGTRVPSRRVRRDTAAAILKVAPTLDVVARGSRVHARTTALRVRALVATGWSVPRIAAAAGVDRQALDPLLHTARRHTRRPWTVKASTAAAVADAYERLWDQAPPEATAGERAAAARSRARAAAAGWKPPAGLDDDNLAQLVPLTRRSA